MGVSNDGIVVFGFDLGGTMPEFLEEFGDMDSYLTETMSIGNIGYPERLKLLNTCPADIVWHNSYDYPCYIMAVRGTEISASRGCPETVYPDRLVVSAERIEAFRIWCEENSVPYTEPAWLLCTMNG